MGINNLIKEIFALNMLKKRGYSIIEEEGNDGIIRLFVMKIGNKKKITLPNGNTHIINKKKRKQKGGITIYQFREKACGVDKNGKDIQTPLDAEILTQIISMARLVGLNAGASVDKKQMFMYLALGGAVGFIINWVIGSLI